jgi:glycogen debranching enzyme
MSKSRQAARKPSEKPHGPPLGGDRADKARPAKKSRSALVESIADALVIKDEDVFFLCDRDGRVPLEGKHGYGLYYHDCRFLDGYQLRLADAELSPLAATSGAGFKADLELANPDVRLADGRLMPKEDVAVRWERMIDSSCLALHDRLTFENFGVETFSFPVALTFAARFEDVFVVRGMQAKSRGKLHPPRWDGGKLVFAYEGSDGLWRGLTVFFDPPPPHTEGATAHFEIELAPHAQKALCASLVMTESDQKNEPLPALGGAAFEHGEETLHQGSRRWMERQTRCHTDNAFLDHVLHRGLLDLHVLRARLDGCEYFAAGVPWYVTLFGRDSLIASLESLAFEPEVAGQTLRLLARYQGTKVDDWRDEQPGKIMHELRVGELAHDNEIPQTPYYGSIDATPLFLILVGLQAEWAGSLDLFGELRGNVERALEWMAKYGDPEGSGYLAYKNRSSKGLANQGWKDSGDAISNGDGSLAKPPIALAEVQGYAYLAKTLVAGLFRRAGDADRAAALEKEARELRERFNRDFWLEDQGVYAIALQAGNRPAATVTSNAGQVLWSGIADPDKAKRVAERLTAADMFNGWGVRTLSEKEKRYNPIGYHLGTVWPHDNALIAAGFRRYGLDEAAGKVCAGVVAAGAHFPNFRLPEVFAGFRRKAFGLPVHYPVACHPQAWAAGAVPYMLTTLLGLEPEAFDGRLRVVRPVLPDGCARVELRGLRVGAARVDLRFARLDPGKVGVEVLDTRGKLDVVTEA